MANVILEYEKHNISVDLCIAEFKEAFLHMKTRCREVQVGLIEKADIEWCDVYIAIRPNIPESAIMAQIVKAAKKVYAVYFDDDLLNRIDSLKKRNEATRQCLTIADIIMGVNPVLLGEYQQLFQCSRIVTLNTIVQPRDFAEYSPRKDVVQILYAAGMGHEVFFDTYISPILPQLIDKYKEKIHFTFVGVHPRIENLGPKNMFTFEPLMSIENYNLYMKKNHFDIGVAPLLNTPFCNNKYFNKFIEYSKAGVPGIYSNCMPATLIVVDGENGLLVDADPQKWLTALSYAIDNELEMKNCVINAQELLKEKFTLESSIQTLREHIPELENEHVDSTGYNIKWNDKSFNIKLFRAQDTLFKICKRLRNYLH